MSIPLNHAFCPPHWRMVPSRLQRRIVALWRARLRRPNTPTVDAHRAAIDTAAREIRLRLNTGQDTDLADAHQAYSTGVSDPLTDRELVATNQAARDLDRLTGPGGFVCIRGPGGPEEARAALRQARDELLDAAATTVLLTGLPGGYRTDRTQEVAGA